MVTILSLTFVWFFCGTGAVFLVYRLLQMNENGLPKYWGKKYTKGIHNFNKCKIQERKPVGEAKILTLQDISSAFILLSIGSVASIFAFALELMFNRIKRISKRKRQVDSI